MMAQFLKGVDILPSLLWTKFKVCFLKENRKTYIIFKRRKIGWKFEKKIKNLTTEALWVFGLWFGYCRQQSYAFSIKLIWFWRQKSPIQKLVMTWKIMSFLKIQIVHWKNCIPSCDFNGLEKQFLQQLEEYELDGPCFLAPRSGKRVFGDLLASKPAQSAISLRFWQSNFAYFLLVDGKLCALLGSWSLCW